MKRRKDKEQQILAAMDALDRGVRTLEKFGARYDEYIDKAAASGDDARARQLIRQKHRVYSIAKLIGSLKSNLELGAFSSHALSQLSGLPDALAACKGLLSEMPDLDKLTKSLQSLFSSMNETEKGLEALNRALEPQPVETIGSRLDGASAYEEDNSEWFQAEYAAMIERLKANGGAPISAPAAAASAVGAPTGEIDYRGIIEEEKKRQ